MKTLIVDDEPFALKVLSHQLRQLGFDDVTGYDQPGEAIRRLEDAAHGVALVLLDLQMPDIDGIEFIRHLARVQYAGALVLVSGEDERILQTASRLAAAHRLDVRGTLRKPSTPAQLQTLLGTAPAAAAPRRAAAPAREYSKEWLLEAMRDRQLVNYYQPKVSFRTGEVVGVETLVRWNHPEDGLVFPDRFIPLAEEHHLIDQLTRVVLHGALAQARLWREAGLSLRVAVNVSMDNLESLDFPDFVVAAMAEFGLPRESLILEITETRLIKNALAVLDIVTRLRLKHIGLSIDDFGTGHSSLAQLRDIPFDELKIDRGFVHGATTDPASRALLEASLDMARQLKLHAVAEGVEDLDDWRLLQSLGCDLAQGYFIARPMPADLLPGWIAEWEARRGALLPPD